MMTIKHSKVAKNLFGYQLSTNHIFFIEQIHLIPVTHLVCEVFFQILASNHAIYFCFIFYNIAPLVVFVKELNIYSDLLLFLQVCICKNQQWLLVFCTYKFQVDHYYDFSQSSFLAAFFSPPFTCMMQRYFTSYLSSCFDTFPTAPLQYL